MNNINNCLASGQSKRLWCQMCVRLRGDNWIDFDRNLYIRNAVYRTLWTFSRRFSLVISEFFACNWTKEQGTHVVRFMCVECLFKCATHRKNIHTLRTGTYGTKLSADLSSWIQLLSLFSSVFSKCILTWRRRVGHMEKKGEEEEQRHRQSASSNTNVMFLSSFKHWFSDFWIFPLGYAVVIRKCCIYSNKKPIINLPCATTLETICTRLALVHFSDRQFCWIFNFRRKN